MKYFNIDMETSYDILIGINSKSLEVGGMTSNFKFGNDFNSVYAHAE